MATTIWRGHLTFGLVSIPVRLFKAARAEKVRFHQLHKSRGSKQEPAPAEAEPAPRGKFRLEPVPRVSELRNASPRQSEAVAQAEVEQYTRVRQSVYVPAESAGPKGVEAETKPIPRSELVKGYEYDKDRYVVIEDEDLKKITPQTATEMQILEFVKLDEIDPVYFETSYYVAPDEAGEKPYSLLFQAMRETHFVALAEVAMHRREHVMIVRPGSHGLLAHTMFYADEIRQDQEHHTDTGVVVARELQMAKLLVESLAAPFEPGKYKDKVREKLEALIAAKVEGREVATVETAHKPARAVDILQALEQSLQLVRKPAASSDSTGPQRKPRQRKANS